MNDLPNTFLPPPREVPRPRSGLLHIIDAAGYSVSGFGRLWQESAARLEVLGGLMAATTLAFCDASVTEWLVFAGLFCAVLAMEAINTALEVLTDRVSPGWSLDAKHVKDLGSLAVALLILVTAGHVLMVLYRAL